ncbi:MAG: chemotaxis protein CheW [Rhodospirillaceae bacterium]|nr:chemotaxis protein CheW [Rhodospirillaceae bacterium]
MANELATQSSHDMAIGSGKETEDFVTFKVGAQIFGVPVLNVRDILHLEKIAFIPLAPPQVAGSINLRGQIVTVIDVRVCLGLTTQSVRIDDSVEGEQPIGVTIEKGSDLYTLLVDEIGDVLSVADDQKEPIPNTIDPKWREYATCIYRLEGELLIVLDSDRLAESNIP